VAGLSAKNLKNVLKASKLNRTTATTKEIQGLYEHVNSEGRFYLLLAQVELAKFLKKAERLTEEIS
jgi:uncharacterized protein (UPF0335 family)